MILNLLSPITLFVKNVFDFLVKTTGSTTMAYVSLILVGALAVALVVFTILAIIGSCKRKKTTACKQAGEEPKTLETTKTIEESTSTVAETSETTNFSKEETTPSEEPTCEESATENGETNSSSEVPTESSDTPTAQNKPRRNYDDIPAMPIYRKSKYEKPKTILVKKDKSKLRNQ